jgi:hypothetical protein
LRNLFPEPHFVLYRNKQEGSYVKDGWENKLHAEVCNGSMTLSAARKIMAKGLWING